MTITIIHGSPRKGNTYLVTQIVKNELLKYGAVEFVEYNMPKDLPEFCCGCMNCFIKGDEYCPHSKYTIPIINSILETDALIITSPVFVGQATGSIINLLDHCAYLFIIHRPDEKMFNKKAFIISTTAGSGTKAVINSMSRSLKGWGINRIYSTGIALFSPEWETIKNKRKIKLEQRIKNKSKHFYKEVISQKRYFPYIFSLMLFYIFRIAAKKYDQNTSLDKRYWIEKGWFTKNPLIK
jgi:multimeric flavodoxin WrbA